MILESGLPSWFRRRLDKENLDPFIESGKLEFSDQCCDFDTDEDYSEIVIEFAVDELIDEFDQEFGEEYINNNIYPNTVDIIRSLCRSFFEEDLKNEWISKCKTKEQDKLVSEITVGKGILKSDPLNELFDEFVNKPKVLKLTRKYLENVSAPNLESFTDENLSDYLESLINVRMKVTFPKYYYSPDVVTGLAYFLAKNIFGFKKSYGLNYFITKTSRQKYWFFDPEIKQFIGYISVGDGIDSDSIHSDSSVKIVDFVAIDKAFKGQGYGTKMYLTILSGVDFLMSDTLLYSESLNIWVNVLPKYAKVWAKTFSEEKPFAPVTRRNFIKPDDVKFYIASLKKDIQFF